MKREVDQSCDSFGSVPVSLLLHHLLDRLGSPVLEEAFLPGTKRFSATSLGMEPDEKRERKIHSIFVFIWTKTNKQTNKQTNRLCLPNNSKQEPITKVRLYGEKLSRGSEAPEATQVFL